ncbi:MAG: NAD(P)-dependent glycerol-3-phosphate dehydrogenase [SAR324 cluster bacterium]|nr:NAD(P)-dependent glycerol-3-phosphate dehydrogenase [SAR324 cluster bacterium]MBL7034424.1 NAD(P)-dependent glycerol-3-phosphate dehydrogenase [SAR324 cluster bacterium]
MRSEGFKIGVIGAGAWGTALARLLVLNGSSVQLWCHEVETANNIHDNHLNPQFLPDIPLPETLDANTDLLEVVRNSRILVATPPSHFTREIAKKMRPQICAEHILLILSKGIEQHSLALMSEIYAEELGNLPQIAILSGPTFAHEVALDLPSAAVLACKDETAGNLLQKCFHSDRFRLYRSTDLVGVQLGGAIKNVIAIASGIADGMQLGLNARAALICRGVAEMTRLGTKMGGSPETFMGMSGIGDLVLTATGNLSRNHNLGEKLGRGFSLEECLPPDGAVAEGVLNAVSIHELAERHLIEMPLCSAVFQVLHQGISCVQALQQLLERERPDEEVMFFPNLNNNTVHANQQK